MKFFRLTIIVCSCMFTVFASTGTLAASPEELFSNASQNFWDGKYERAEGTYQKLLENHPESGLEWDAKFGMARAVYKQGDLDRANKMFSKVRDNHPDKFVRGDAFFSQIEIAILKDNTIEARGMLKAFLDIYPNHVLTSNAKKQLSLLKSVESNPVTKSRELNDNSSETSSNESSPSTEKTGTSLAKSPERDDRDESAEQSEDQPANDSESPVRLLTPPGLNLTSGVKPSGMTQKNTTKGVGTESDGRTEPTENEPESIKRVSTKSSNSDNVEPRIRRGKSEDNPEPPKVNTTPSEGQASTATTQTSRNKTNKTNKEKNTEEQQNPKEQQKPVKRLKEASEGGGAEQSSEARLPQLPPNLPRGAHGNRINQSVLPPENSAKKSPSSPSFNERLNNIDSESNTSSSTPQANDTQDSDRGSNNSSKTDDSQQSQSGKQTADRMRMKVEDAINAGNYDEAWKHQKTLMDNATPSPEDFHRAARIQSERGMKEEAIDYINKAVKRSDLKWKKYLLEKMEMLFKAKRYSEFDNTIQQVESEFIDKASQDEKAHFMYLAGKRQLKAGNTDNAFFRFIEAVRTESSKWGPKAQKIIQNRL